MNVFHTGIYKNITGQVLTTIDGFKISRKFSRCLIEAAIVVHICLKGLDLVPCFRILIFCGASFWKDTSAKNKDTICKLC